MVIMLHTAEQPLSKDFLLISHGDRCVQELQAQSRMLSCEAGRLAQQMQLLKQDKLNALDLLHTKR